MAATSSTSSSSGKSTGKAAAPHPENHAAFVGQTFVKAGEPDREAWTVDDVVRLRWDGYKPAGEQ
jgi:hypothetical protein